MSVADLPAMNMVEAAKSVRDFLSTQVCAIHSEMRAWELENGRFRIAVQQVQPEVKQRVFDVVALDVVDCWEMKEIEHNAIT